VEESKASVVSDGECSRVLLEGLLSGNIPAGKDDSSKEAGEVE
jgi:hypothetical protein